MIKVFSAISLFMKNPEMVSSFPVAVQRFNVALAQVKAYAKGKSKGPGNWGHTGLAGVHGGSTVGGEI